MTSSTVESLAQRPIAELRAMKPTRRLALAAARARAARVKRQIGVTRVAEIGRFVDRGIHVCQATRPKLHDHHSTGMNTGAQGKGKDLRQAYVSAVIEAAESYCAETRVIDLVRGSYEQLREVHVIAEPSQFEYPETTVRIDPTAPQLWTKALHLDLGVEALVPAELVYLFLHPRSYGCALGYYRSSIGLGAGFDPYTATVKAIYEVLEHHYRAHFPLRGVTVEGFVEEGAIARIVRGHSREFRSRYQVLFCAVTLQSARQNVPFVVCFMGDEQYYFGGWGIDLDPLAAIERAYIEAFQNWATAISGARERMASPGDRMGTRPYDAIDLKSLDRVWPDAPTLSVSAFARRYAHLRSGGDELARLRRVLRRNGFADCYLVNLSRYGIDCSVVRALVPGVAVDAHPWSTEGITQDEILRRQFRFGEPAR